MAIVFVPGKSYFVLDSAQYSAMLDLLADLELDFDLAADFEQGSDGNYYIEVGSSKLSADELSFMEDWGFANELEYKKSTQSTNFF